MTPNTIATATKGSFSTIVFAAGRRPTRQSTKNMTGTNATAAPLESTEQQNNTSEPA